MTKVTITTMLLSEEAPCSGEAAEGREGVSGQEMVVATSQNTWRIGEGTWGRFNCSHVLLAEVAARNLGLARSADIQLGQRDVLQFDGQAELQPLRRQPRNGTA